MTTTCSKTGNLKAKLFRGLGDGSRLAILEALRDGPRVVSDIVDATGLTQPNTSMHLDCLRCCGLVSRERKGRFVEYRIRSARILRLLRQADAVLDEVAEGVSACGRYRD